MRTEVIGAIVEAVSYTYVLVIVAGVLVALMSLLMKRERLSAELLRLMLEPRDCINGGTSLVEDSNGDGACRLYGLGHG